MNYLMIGAGHFLDNISDSEYYKLSLRDLLKMSGGNSGNYMIGHGVKFHIESHIKKHGGSFTYMPWSEFQATHYSELNEKFDQVVLAGANMINEKADFSFAFNKLSRTNLPIAAMGVGAQAETFDTKISPPEGTKKFFQLIADRSESIGVRGEYTEKVLQSIGITDTTVNGCPSYYVNKKNPDFKIVKSKPSLLNVSFLMKRDRNKYAADEMLKLFQRRALREIKDSLGRLVVQTDFAEASVSFNKTAEDDVWARLKRYFQIKESEEKSFSNFFKNNTGIYFKHKQWLDNLEGVDFSYGARFHGNMVALMSGIPALKETLHKSCRWCLIATDGVESGYTATAR